MQINNSARLSYRFTDAADAALFFELDQDPAVMRYIKAGQPSSWHDINQVFLPRLQSYRDPVRGYGIWAVSTLADQQFIGWILARPMHFFSVAPQWHNLELGWRFKQAYWGQGLAFEAANTVAQALAALPQVQALSALAVQDNQASIRVMQKLGMQFVSQAVHADPLGDHEVVIYQKLLV